MCKIYKRDKSQRLENSISLFAKMNDLHFSSSTDIIEVCRMLRLQAKYMPLDDTDMDGFILVNNKNRLIAINQSLSPVDARFLIAHELAHYIDESDETHDGEFIVAAKDKLFHGEEKSPNEHNMDYMAAAILVPKDQFLDDIIKLGIKPRRFKDCEEEQIRDIINNENLITFLARKYRVRERLIVRRIGEVSYYA